MFMKNFRKENFIQKTIYEFQGYSKYKISEEEAINIQENLFDYVNLLITWNQSES